jgi:hypothetical protein
MKRYQLQLQRIFSSVTLGIGSFLFTVPVTLFLGDKLIKPSQHGHAFFSQQEMGLLLFSILLGLVIAIAAGVKCYRYLGKSK